MLFLISTLHSKDNKKFKTPEFPVFWKPFSINAGIGLSNYIFITTPETNALVDISQSFRVSIGASYNFFKWFALDSSFSVETGYRYQRSEFIEVTYNERHTVDLAQADVFFAYNIYTLFKIPLKIKKENLNKAKIRFVSLFFRLGLSFEGWLESYYFIYDNDQLQNEGSFFDDVDDGPNAWGDYNPYVSVINRFNPVLSIGFGSEIYKTDHFALVPELRYSFYPVKIYDGTLGTEPVEGATWILIRNDGEYDEAIADYKMNIQALLTFKFSFGTYDDNLYKYMKKKKK